VFDSVSDTTPSASAPVWLRRCTTSGTGGWRRHRRRPGGALRSQDRRSSGDPVTLDGTVIRITTRPGTSEAWLGDVGWAPGRRSTGSYRAARSRTSAGRALRATSSSPATVTPTLPSATAWPPARSPGRSTAGSTVAPGRQWLCRHRVGGRRGGLADPAGNYPAAYHNGLFYADYTRGCIGVIPAGSGGLPDPAQAQVFATDTFGSSSPRSTRTRTCVGRPWPLGASRQLHRRQPGTGDQGQRQPDQRPGPPRSYTAKLKVTDSRGLASDPASVTITAGNSPPAAVIDTPTPPRTWTVGDTIGFSGHTSDPRTTRCRRPGCPGR